MTRDPDPVAVIVLGALLLLALRWLAMLIF